MSTIAVPAEFPAIAGLHARLRAAGAALVEIERASGEPPTPQTLAALVAGADAIVAEPAMAFPAGVLRAAPRLRLVCSPVIGTDHIDVEAATELGVLVANCPTDEIVIGMAEASVMLMVALLLELKRKEASLRAGAWRLALSSHLLRGRTVGLVGYGRIARAVAARLQGWQVTLQVYDPYVAGTIPLDRLLTTSDVISIHTPRTPETVGLIGRRELELMKPTAVLVSTGRGGTVDEVALAEAIDAGRLAGAAVDVFEREPIDMDNPLLQCDPGRVILTPHAVGHNLETGPAGVEAVVQAVERVMHGEPPTHVINPDAIARWRERILGLPQE
ncbi:MAG: dehydrogenase [Chloroflexi bacterium]|nr:dehydrogenase [Chloroflexota bacterium]